MKKVLLFLLLLSGFSFVSLAQTKSIAANNANIQYFGRWNYANPLAPICNWPSLYLKAKFNGTGITANFTNTLNAGANLVHVLYTIDGGSPVYVNGVTQIVVSGLSAGVHEIMISRRVEANGVDLSFNGFVITGGDIVAPNARPCLKFEFVGNSITCGFAAENFSSTWNDGKGTWLAAGWEQNAYKSYAPVLSRDMAAEYRVESHSGQGMAVNLDNSLPEAKASDEWEFKSYYPGWAKAGWNTKYDFAADAWRADFFFTCLGTNDWADGNYNAGVITTTNYIARYNQFIDLVYQKNPKATFIVLSSLLAVRGWQVGNDALKQMVATRKAKGDDIYFIDLRGVLVNQQDFGNDWTHPTTKAHQTMANTIKTFMEGTPAIKSKLDALKASCNGPDCNGVNGGTASVDFCGKCSGGNTGVVPNSTCTIDCNGTANGTAKLDSCAVCAGGTTGKVFNAGCAKDCSGKWGGTAKLEGCAGECTGGTTGKAACGVGICADLQFNSSSEYSSATASGNLVSSSSGGAWVLTGNATGAWDAGVLTLKTPVDFTNGAVLSKKMYLRVKASSKVILQPSFMDGKGDIVSNSNLAGWNSSGNLKKNSIEATTTWTDYVIDFDGNFTNQYGCACNVDQNNITKVYMSVNAGWGTAWPPLYKDGSAVSAFTGTIQMEYLKIADENCGSVQTSAVTLEEAAQYSVFPNPSTGSFTVAGYNGLYQIISVDGKVVESGAVNAGGAVGENLPSGYFILQIQKNNDQVYLPIIKM